MHHMGEPTLTDLCRRNG